MRTLYSARHFCQPQVISLLQGLSLGIVAPDRDIGGYLVGEPGVPNDPLFDTDRSRIENVRRADPDQDLDGN